MPQARYTKVGLPRPTVLALAFVMLLGMIAAAAAPAAAQPVGPVGPGPGHLLPPPFPAGSGAASAPKQGVDKSRPRRTGSVASMKLLAPNVGLATNGPQLLWTSSGGSEWEDITPPGPKDGWISDIFFLDTRRGWVLFAHGEPDIIGGLQFDLASTDNAGASWSMRHVAVPERKYPGLLNGGILAFADSVHGWLGLGAGMSAGSRGTGVLLATGDGGETWKLATATGWDKDEAIGSMLMLTPERGWMVGGGANEELLVTRDGGRTWQRIELESPVKTDLMRQYDRNLEQFERIVPASPPACCGKARKEGATTPLLCRIRSADIRGSQARLCLRYLSWGSGIVRHRGRRSYLEAGPVIDRIARASAGSGGGVRHGGLYVDHRQSSKRRSASAHETRPRRQCCGYHDASS